MDTVTEPSSPAATPALPPNYGPTEAQGPPPGYGPQPGYGPPPGQGPPGGAGPSGGADHGFGRVLRSATTAWIVAGVLALVVVALSVALASANSDTTRVNGPFRAPAGGLAPAFGGSAPGSGGGRLGGPGPSGGAEIPGVFGTVASVGSGSFTVTDRTGQTVTVDEQSSTTYFSGRTAASSSAVVTGARVAVRGTRSGSTVTAASVVVLPAGGFGLGPAS